MSAVLEVSNLTLRYGPVTAVDNLSLKVEAGETLGLIGESGCGKSSVARAITGLAKPTAGEILFKGGPLHGPGTARDRAAKVQLLFQDPAASLSPRMRLHRQIEEPLRILGRLTPETKLQLSDLLAEVGLSPALLDRYPHQISGGQARRVALVRALSTRPGLLVADEPTAGLDLSVQGDLLNLLRRLRASHGLSYLFISHNLNVIGRVTDRLAVMYLGEIVESGPTREIFAAPAHPYTRALLAANLGAAGSGRGIKREPLKGDVPSPANPPPGCRFHQRCPVAQDLCRVKRPQPITLPSGRQVTCHFPLTQPHAQKAGADHV